MTIEILGQHDGDAVFIYDGYEARIPLLHIHVLSHNAAVRDQGYAAYGGKRYDRDALAALRRDLDNGALYPLDTCTEAGCDQAEHPDPSQPRPKCAAHRQET